MNYKSRFLFAPTLDTTIPNGAGAMQQHAHVHHTIALQLAEHISISLH